MTWGRACPWGTAPGLCLSGAASSLIRPCCRGLTWAAGPAAAWAQAPTAALLTPWVAGSCPEEPRSGESCLGASPAHRSRERPAGPARYAAGQRRGRRVTGGFWLTELTGRAGWLGLLLRDPRRGPDYGGQEQRQQH